MRGSVPQNCFDIRTTVSGNTCSWKIVSTLKRLRKINVLWSSILSIGKIVTIVMLLMDCKIKGEFLFCECNFCPYETSIFTGWLCSSTFLDTIMSCSIYWWLTVHLLCYKTSWWFDHNITMLPHDHLGLKLFPIKLSVTKKLQNSFLEGNI